MAALSRKRLALRFSWSLKNMRLGESTRHVACLMLEKVSILIFSLLRSLIAKMKSEPFRYYHKIQST